VHLLARLKFPKVHLHTGHNVRVEELAKELEREILAMVVEIDQGSMMRFSRNLCVPCVFVAMNFCFWP